MKKIATLALAAALVMVLFLGAGRLPTQEPSLARDADRTEYSGSEPEKVPGMPVARPHPRGLPRRSSVVGSA